MAPFGPKHSLLNPLFEGYRLDAINQGEVLACYPLAYTLNQSTVASRSPLSFQEVQSRIRHNHLVIGPYGNAVYVDSGYKVVAVEIDKVSSSAADDATHR